MPSIDLVVVLSIGVATASTGWVLWNRGARGWRLVRSAWVALSGLVLVITMAAHCIDVLSRLYLGSGYDGTPWTYDFRTYSLLLLGALLVGCGAVVFRSALASAENAAAARKGAMRTILVVLALVVPLLPIHAVFAAPLTMIATLAFLALWRERAGGARSPAEIGVAASGTSLVGP